MFGNSPVVDKGFDSDQEPGEKRLNPPSSGLSPKSGEHRECRGAALARRDDEE